MLKIFLELRFGTELWAYFHSDLFLYCLIFLSMKKSDSKNASQRHNRSFNNPENWIQIFFSPRKVCRSFFRFVPNAAFKSTPFSFVAAAAATFQIPSCAKMCPSTKNKPRANPQTLVRKCKWPIFCVNRIPIKFFFYLSKLHSLALDAGCETEKNRKSTHWNSINQITAKTTNTHIKHTISIQIFSHLTVCRFFDVVVDALVSLVHFSGSGISCENFFCCSSLKSLKTGRRILENFLRTNNGPKTGMLMNLQKSVFINFVAFGANTTKGRCGIRSPSSAEVGNL